MSYEYLGLLASVLLLVLASVTSISAFSYYKYNNNAGRLRYYILAMGIFSGLWCLGYGSIGICGSVAANKIIRKIAVLGVDGFVLTDALLIFDLSKLKKWLKTGISGLFTAIMVLDWVIFSGSNVDKFFRVGSWTTLEIHNMAAYSFHTTVIKILTISLFIFSVRLLIVTKSSRLRKFVSLYILSNILMLLACLPDTFHLFKYSISTSGIGAAVSELMLWFAAAKFDTFRNTDIVYSASEKKARVKYRQQYIVTIIMALVALILIVYFSFGSSYKQTKTDSLAIGKYSAAQSAAMVSNFLLTSKNVLQTTGETVNYMLKAGDSVDEVLAYITEQSTSYKERIEKSFNGIYGVFNGQYLDGSAWQPPEDYNLYVRPWYIKAVEAGGQVTFTDPYVDAQTGEVMISVCQLLDDGESVISMDVRLDSLQKVIESIDMGDKSYSFLINRNGLIIAHTDKSKVGDSYLDSITNSRDGQSQIAKAYMQVIDNSFEGQEFLEITVDGKKMAMFLNSVDETIYVISVVDESEFFSNVTYGLYRNIFLSLLVFIAVFYFCNTSYKSRLKALDAANSKSNFLANMSHEIRTPINAVIGLNEMIIKESKEPEIVNYAMDVDSSGRMLLSIINDILDFSKIESGKINIIPVKYSVVSMINDLNAVVRPKANEKKLEFNIDIDSKVPNLLYGDEVRIRQIIINLLSNAVKYTDSGSIKLQVKVSYDSSKLENGDDIRLIVAVSDTGRGIKDEDIKDLFESFTRIDEKKNRNIEGTGLGLAITNSFTKLMGGTLAVESQYGKGSTFTVVIPQRIEDPTVIGDNKTDYAEVSNKKNIHEITFRAPGKRILVVDDVYLNCKVVLSFLKNTGIEIITAKSGQESIDKSREMVFDLIFMDHMMPEMDGIEAFHHIRDDADSLNRNTKVVALTANAISGMREMYIEEGFTDYLTKPVNSKQLEDMLKKYIEV